MSRKLTFLTASASAIAGLLLCTVPADAPALPLSTGAVTTQSSASGVHHLDASLFTIQATLEQLGENGQQSHSIERPATDPPDLNLLVTDGSRKIYIVGTHPLKLLGVPELPFPVHGVPALAPDGRHAYVPTEGGWLYKLDIEHRRWITRIRSTSGLGKQHVIVSGDSAWIVVAQECSDNLVVLDKTLVPTKLLPIRDRKGQRKASVMAMYTAPLRESFVIVLRGLAEIWEISYNRLAPEIPIGIIHDFQYREGAFVPGFLNPVRSTLSFPAKDYVSSPDNNEVMVATASSQSGEIMHLDTRRPIGRWEVSESPPRLQAGNTWKRLGSSAVVAAPNKSGNTITFIDMEKGSQLKQVALTTHPASVHSHPLSPNLWVLPNPRTSGSDHVILVDKQTMGMIGTLPSPIQATPTGVTFTKDGRLVLVNYSGPTGGIVAYDGLNHAVLGYLRNPGLSRIHSSLTTATVHPPDTSDPESNYCTP